MTMTKNQTIADIENPYDYFYLVKQRDNNKVQIFDYDKLMGFINVAKLSYFKQNAVNCNDVSAYREMLDMIIFSEDIDFILETCGYLVLPVSNEVTPKDFQKIFFEFLTDQEGFEADYEASVDELETLPFFKNNSEEQLSEAMKSDIVHTYALLIPKRHEKQLIKALAKKNNQNDFEDFEDMFVEFFSFDDARDIVLYVDADIDEASFVTLKDKTALTDEYIDGGLIVPLLHQPQPFKAAYSSLEDMVEELKSLLGEYLPKNFNYEDHIGLYKAIL